MSLFRYRWFSATHKRTLQPKVIMSVGIRDYQSFRNLIRKGSIYEGHYGNNTVPDENYARR
jgi:hypothetical protein